MSASKLNGSMRLQLPLLVLLFLISCQVVAASTWALGGTISRITLPLALLLSAVIQISSRRVSVAQTLLLVCILVAAGTLLCFVSSFVYDRSWDGPGYHIPMALSLSEGWNPLFEHHAPLRCESSLFIDHYPKGWETVLSTVHPFTSDIEWSKGLNLLLILASWLLAWETLAIFLGDRLGARKVMAYSIFAAFSPVAVLQATTFMVDFLTCSLLLSLICLVLLYRREHRFDILLAIGACLALGISSKILTGFFLYLCLAVAMGWALKDRAFSAFRAFFLIGAISGLIGTSLLAFNPYVTNWSDHGHPLYPLMSARGSKEGPIDIMSVNTPPSLRGSTRWMIVPSYLSIPDNGNLDRLKFGLPSNPKGFLPGYDTRVGGFGAFFPALLVLSFLLFFTARPEGGKHKQVLSAIAIFSFAGIFIFREGWWARYVPFFWFAPLAVLASFELSRPRWSWQRHAATAMRLLLAASILSTAISVVYSDFAHTGGLKAALVRLKASGSPVELCVGSSVGMVETFRKAQIPVVLTDSIVSPEGWNLISIPKVMVHTTLPQVSVVEKARAFFDRP